MNEDRLTEVLDRLEAFLAQDPDNTVLRREVFDEALRCGEAARALAIAEEAAQRAGGWTWRAHRAHALMALHRWHDARDALWGLMADSACPSDSRESLAHDLGYVAWQLGDPGEAIGVLEPVCCPQSASDVPVGPLVQALWLRVLHQSGRVDDALAWAQARWRAGQLSPSALGVASLVALDAGHLAMARSWSESAIEQGETTVEAIVASASVALADRDVARASKGLEPAVERRPGEPRVRSLRAFACLMSGDYAMARAEFELALTLSGDHIGTWHGLGWTGVLMKDLHLARKAFEAALDRDRNVADSHGGIAVVESLEGKGQAARLSIERALRLDRRCLSARYAEAILDGTASDQQVLSALVGAIAPPGPA